MADVIARLHDLQDESEDRSAEIRAGVNTIVEREVEALLERGVPVDELFEELALAVEESLADETTAAVRIGYEVGRRGLT